MFGYISVNKPEMKFREFDVYRSYYCGFCRTLKSSYGISGQLTLSYDLTFLIILLSDLYDNEGEKKQFRCMVHPTRKQTACTNIYSEYAADMNLLLAFYKCQDDWTDERKIYMLAESKLLLTNVRKIEARYPHKAEVIRTNLSLIRDCELRNEENLDVVSGYFGEIMAEIFAYEDDIWADTLRRMGFYLGKFIYLMDAYDDIEEDIKKNNYNPFKNIFSKNDDFEGYCYNILRMMMAECSKAFEMLPVVENAEILRNILYAGVWTRYEMVHNKRLENKKD